MHASVWNLAPPRRERGQLRDRIDDALGYCGALPTTSTVFR